MSFGKGCGKLSANGFSPTCSGRNDLSPPDAAYRRLKSLLREAGITESIPFHGLRHTFSTHALASGVDAKTLSGILGHTDAAFTLNTYTHVTDDMQRQASVIVGNFMEDIFGKELKPWQNAENGAKEAST